MVKKHVRLGTIDTSVNTADMGTKALPIGTFLALLAMLPVKFISKPVGSVSPVALTLMLSGADGSMAGRVTDCD